MRVSLLFLLQLTSKDAVAAGASGSGVEAMDKSDAAQALKV